MNITRRFFLQSTGAVALYCGLSPLDLLGGVGLSEADLRAVKPGRTLVIIFLRGGMDGLNFIVPFKDPGYKTLRSSIRLGEPGAADGVLDLDGFFGLNPRAAALRELFHAGQATALHAVGYSRNTRSHFEEQDVWETGVIGNTINSDGWLNRHLVTSLGHGPVRAVSIGDNLPRILRGKAAAYAVRGVSDLTMPGTGKEDGALMKAALEHAYCTPPREHESAAGDLLAQTAQSTLEGLGQIRKVAEQPYQPGAEYPKTDIARRLQDAARLIKGNLGVEVMEIDYGGWDTHQHQGGAGGNHGNLVQNLAEAIAAFHRDLGNRMNDVLLLTISDFGRTAAENGNGGTDHGWANAMLAVGGNLAQAGGGKPMPVRTKWPGLLKEQLHEGRDLLHTTDFRDVLGEVVGMHLGNAHLKTILPQHDFKTVGMLRTA
ncbi:MAG: DUF1501 domain-containing protein [Terrimicrobiaceae bacterium]|nr:DUF1501 domain-containing protein [Terrimicrobiaceae bacterium]